jgi:hypothetical protein
MSIQYAHLLIPERADFVPLPEQVAAFLDGLVKLNSAPAEATFKVGKLSGKVRTGVNALTGEKLSIPRRDFASFGSVSDIPGQLVAMEDYDVVVSGEGPAKLPPFTLYSTTGSEQSEFKGTYSYEVRCCLRAEVVSTCETPPFGSQCPSEMRIGAFRNPSTGTPIEVPNAGCARSWIEFQFGKWLLPRIGDDLNLLEPSVLANATDSFGMGFAQGCLCR